MSNDIQNAREAAPDKIAQKERSRYSDAALTPPVDVIEDESGITLYADLPGVSRDKLNLQVEAATLTIEAESALATGRAEDQPYGGRPRPFPPRLHAQQGTGHAKRDSRACAGCAEAANSEGDPCPAAAHRHQGNLVVPLDSPPGCPGHRQGWNIDQGTATMPFPGKQPPGLQRLTVSRPSAGDSQRSTPWTPPCLTHHLRFLRPSSLFPSPKPCASGSSSASSASAGPPARSRSCMRSWSSGGAGSAKSASCMR